jgi:mannose-6-phosphate isomerase-like protein (cupin superfamily)
MAQTNPPIPQIVDAAGIDWSEHPRFRAIRMKTLLASADNPLAGVNLVLVPPDGVIGRHHHVAEIETVYVLAGASVLTLGDVDLPFVAGQIVAIPAGMEHALRNTGAETVELLCIFTPPLA